MILEQKIKKLEKKFIKLYKQAINYKSDGKEHLFFSTDKKMQTVAEEIYSLKGGDEYDIKENLLIQARNEYNN